MYEIGAHRMHHECGVDGGGRSRQRLGDDVTAVQTAPWIRVADADERVGAVRFECDEIVEIHTPIVVGSGHANDNEHVTRCVTLDFEVAGFGRGEDEHLLLTGRRLVAAQVEAVHVKLVVFVGIHHRQLD